jgi:glyoxylase-like metal-dependent hydrolase (beta-lactamase superfamily II)/rhodanese-related sulfurtransferase
MYFRQFYLGCLAHASYLVGDGGEAAVIDPQRDVEQYLGAAAQAGLVITHVIETHLHADFVSGHHELAGRTGARIYLGKGSGATFPHVAVGDGDAIQMGNVTLRFLATPGHTPESVSILIAESGEPRKLLTGDTLFIGDVGRPDLVGARGYSSVEMAAMLYDSLHDKILTLPDSVEIYPAHGAGSACGRNISSETSSTIGTQRRTNWALQPMTKGSFIAVMTTDLPAPPPYFGFDAEMNRRGAARLDWSSLRGLSPDQVAAHALDGATILDVRDAGVYGRGHLPGSINLGLDGQFASWAGTLLPLTTPVVLVAENEACAREAAVRLARVGIERIAGWLADGVEGWTHSGRRLASVAQITVAELKAQSSELPVLDVRRAVEHEAGRIPGAVNVPLAELEARVRELDPGRPMAVACAHGYRSSAACSLLERRGFRHLVNVVGGISSWIEAGFAVESGAR